MFVILSYAMLLGLAYAVSTGLWRMAGQEVGMGFFVIVPGGLLLIIVAFCIIYFLRSNPDDPATDAGTMSLSLRRIIIIYFLVLGWLLVALLVDLSFVDFPEAAVTINEVPTPEQITPSNVPPISGGTSSTAPESATPSPTPTPSPIATPPVNTTQSGSTKPPSGTSTAASSQSLCPAADASSGPPTIQQVIPRTTTGTAPTVYLAVYGKNFAKDSFVQFNGQRRSTFCIGPTLVEAQPENGDIQGKGTITVDVVTGDKISNAITVPVEKPTAPLNLGLWQPAITREVQLLLMVLAAGALGSLVHALRSISDFIGNRTAVASWFWWYVTRPLLGMALALIFYAVLRGGFLAGSPADAKVVNPFGVIAIGALVGMFSDKAAEKLAEIFNTLFEPKTGDTRKDKLAAPIVTRLQPETMKAGTTTPGVLTISGDHLDNIVKVKLDQQERNTKSVTAQQVTVDLQATDVSTARDIAITLVDSQNKSFAAGILHVTSQ